MGQAASLLSQSGATSARKTAASDFAVESITAYDGDAPLFVITLNSSAGRLIPNVFATYDAEETLYWAANGAVALPKLSGLRFKLKAKPARRIWHAVTVIEDACEEAVKEAVTETYRRNPNNVVLIGDLPNGISTSASTVADDYFAEPVEFSWKPKGPLSLGPHHVAVYEYDCGRDAFLELAAFDVCCLEAWPPTASSGSIAGDASCRTALLSANPEAPIALDSKWTALVAGEDGPVFRAAIANLEAKTPALKRHVKTLMRALEDEQAKAASFGKKGSFLEALGEFDAAFVQEQLRAVERQFDAYSCRIQAILAQLHHQYHSQIKTAEQRKRDWEGRSEAFSGTLQRHLVKGKEATQQSEACSVADAKFAARKAAFEVDRVAYAAYLMDLHLLLPAQIALWMRDYSAALCSAVSSGTDAAWLRYQSRVEASLSSLRTSVLDPRDERLNALQLRRDDCLRRWQQQLLDSKSLAAASNPAGMENSSIAASATSKEGFLNISSKSSSLKRSWHRRWCVLAQGQLFEFDPQVPLSDGGSPAGREPTLRLRRSFALALCTVRCSSNHGSSGSNALSYQGRRRFCFEVISAHGWLHVYQAVSGEERGAWIAAIQSQITGWLEGRFGPVSTDEPEEASGSAAAAGEEPSISNNVVDCCATPEALLEMLWKCDPANARCAECGAPHPDWCSINIGALLCIECASVHRSLGTHISKVRSIRLDTAAFTPEMVTLLCGTGNRVANSIWKGSVDAGADRAQREAVIRAKYEAASFFI